MAIQPVKHKDEDKKIEKIERDTTVVKSFTIQKSLLARLEDFRFEHRKNSDSQIIQEALAEFFEKYSEGK